METRKKLRLDNFDYSSDGYYFITICTAQKQKTLGTVVGCGILDAPKTELSETGIIVENQIDVMSNFYQNIAIDKYVIMPNHLHLIIKITDNNGASGTTHQRCVGDATSYNNLLSSFVGALKRFTNKTANCNIWQKSFYDHIIRDETDYLKIWNYIDTNPAKWAEDKYYIE